MAFLKPNWNHRITGAIIPKSAAIFYEEGIPYLTMTGKTTINDQDAEIYFPKIGLAFDQLESRCDSTTVGHIAIEYAQTLYIKNSEYLHYAILPKEMTTEDIERELGYPVVIKDTNR